MYKPLLFKLQQKFMYLVFLVALPIDIFVLVSYYGKITQSKGVLSLNFEGLQTEKKKEQG